MNYNFTEATIKDAQEILDLQIKAYQSEAEIYNDYSIPPLTQSYNEIVEDFKNSHFYIIKDNDKIIGSIKATICDKSVYIGRLIVSPEKQGQGIGSYLLSSVEEKFQNIGRFELFTGHLSSRNLTMYKNRGYKEFKREKLSENSELIFLEKITTDKLS